MLGELYTLTLNSYAHLVEGETVWADPGMLNIILAVVEHLTVEVLIGVISRVLADAVELGLLQQL